MTAPALSSLKVALVYDRVNTPYGGAEKVLVALSELFPSAPLFTSVYNQASAPWANKFNVKSSWLQNIPGASSNHRLLAPLMPLAFESFDLTNFDIVISITSAEAKGVLTLPRQLHVCYLLTPTRYLYSHYDSYIRATGLAKLAAQPLLWYLAWWDKAAHARPDVLIPISKLVAERAKKYYTNNPNLTNPLYPPVEKQPNHSQSFQLPSGLSEYYLVVSRLVAYKRVDLAINACAKLHTPLVIVGDGPEARKLRLLAKQTKSQVLFLPNQEKKAVAGLMNHAKAVLMPGLEDFGITALEALAAHTPVIIHKTSGAAELIQDGKTGIHLQDETVNGLMGAIGKAEQTTFSTNAMDATVRKHTTSAFKQEFKNVLTTLWRNHYVAAS